MRQLQRAAKRIKAGGQQKHESAIFYGTVDYRAVITGWWIMR